MGRTPADDTASVLGIVWKISKCFNPTDSLYLCFGNAEEQLLTLFDESDLYDNISARLQQLQGWSDWLLVRGIKRNSSQQQGKYWQWRLRQHKLLGCVVTGDTIAGKELLQEHEEIFNQGFSFCSN